MSAEGCKFGGTANYGRADGFPYTSRRRPNGLLSQEPSRAAELVRKLVSLGAFSRVRSFVRPFVTFQSLVPRLLHGASHFQGTRQLPEETWVRPNNRSRPLKRCSGGFRASFSKCRVCV